MHKCPEVALPIKTVQTYDKALSGAVRSELTLCSKEKGVGESAGHGLSGTEQKNGIIICNTDIKFAGAPSCLEPHVQFKACFGDLWCETVFGHAIICGAMHWPIKRVWDQISMWLSGLPSRVGMFLEESLQAMNLEGCKVKDVSCMVSLSRNAAATFSSVGCRLSKR